jgi:hypothetical protein
VTFALTNHVVAAYQIHYPEADAPDVKAAIQQAIDKEFILSPETAAQLCGRFNVDRDSTYLVPYDCRGLFVRSKDGAIITYLRFQSRQQELVWSWFRRDQPMTNVIEKPKTGMELLLQEREELARSLQAWTEAKIAKMREVEEAQASVRVITKEQKKAKNKLLKLEERIASIERKSSPSTLVKAVVIQRGDGK